MSTNHTNHKKSVGYDITVWFVTRQEFSSMIGSIIKSEFELLQSIHIFSTHNITYYHAIKNVKKWEIFVKGQCQQ